ncbi:MAG: sigma-70 family RNA polymerase sigma factor [Nitrospinae bacterium]|nr:sigma-70 family RNA polymerase sigma factor [Nitrospinota bacterium]
MTNEEKESESSDLPAAVSETPDSKSVVPYDPLRLYITKARKYPLLSPEEEERLALMYINNKDKDAAYKLVTSHLMLVVKISMKFRTIYQSTMELIQEGNIGLMEALKRFDPYKGARFSTYATWWIRAYILKYIIDNMRIVKVGTTNIRRKLLFKLRGEIERLEREGLYPDVKLLAERFGTDNKNIIDVSHTLSSPDISFDAPLSSDSDSSLLDTYSSGEGGLEERFVEDKMRAGIREKLSAFREGLNDYHKTILDERILSEEPKSLREIGEIFGVSREAVRQAEERVKKKLKTFAEEKMQDYR